MMGALVPMGRGGESGKRNRGYGMGTKGLMGGRGDGESEKEEVRVER